MDEAIIRSLQKRASAGEHRWLAQWWQASSAIEEHYQGLVALWPLTASGRVELPTEPPAAGEILRGAGEARVPARRRGEERTRLRRWAFAAAAAFDPIAIGLPLSSAWMNRGGPAGAPALSFGVKEYHPAADERVNVHLADGSIVRLAPSSVLRFTGRRDAREVELEGQAFFAVAWDPRFPFIVRTRFGDARVLGTRFDLRGREGALRKDCARAPIRADLQRLLEAQRRDTVLARGEQPAGDEPHRKRSASPIKGGTDRRGGAVAAPPAHEPAVPQPPTAAVSAARADEAIGPLQPFQIVEAGGIGPKTGVEVAQGLRVVHAGTTVIHGIKIPVLRLNGYPHSRYSYSFPPRNS